MTTDAALDSRGIFGWWRSADRSARRSFVAAALGWMLDAFDVMLFSLVLTAVMSDLALSRVQAGLLGSLTLVASAAGGLLFGVVADRWGRTRALTWSVLLYSVCTGLCATAQNMGQLVIYRTLLGFGMGGEWASGAALMSETWPTGSRARAFGFVQSAWAVGYGLAAMTAAVVLPRFGWRAVFLVGILPALFAVWIRARVEEPAMWRAARDASRQLPKRRGSLRQIFSHRFAALTVALTVMNALTLFGYWGLNFWVPAYLSLPLADGGAGLGTAAMFRFVVAMQIGLWLGYVTFGFVSDSIGGKKAYVAYLTMAALLVPVYGVVRTPLVLLALGPLVAFFGGGFFSGFGPLTAGIYPTAVRATAQGFTYNMGRIASALAPYMVGTLATAGSFSTAFVVTGGAYLAAALFWILIPDTTANPLD